MPKKEENVNIILMKILKLSQLQYYLTIRLYKILKKIRIKVCDLLIYSDRYSNQKLPSNKTLIMLLNYGNMIDYKKFFKIVKKSQIIEKHSNQQFLFTTC